MLGSGDERLVGVAVAEIDVGLFLQDWIKPAVVDTEGYQLDVLSTDGLGRDGGVLGFEVGGKFWAVVSAIYSQVRQIRK